MHFHALDIVSVKCEAAMTDTRDIITSETRDRIYFIDCGIKIISDSMPLLL